MVRQPSSQGPAKPKPAKRKPATKRPGRGARPTRVEAKILRCAAAGEPADFVGQQAHGGKPTVSAAFLRDLWLGLDPNRTIHPRGLELKGLHITGTLDVSNVARPAGGGEQLCGLTAWDCTFDGAILLAGARLEHLRLERCRIAGTIEPETGEAVALDCEASAIAGTCSLNRIETDSLLGFSRATIERGLAFLDCRELSEIRLGGARIQGPLIISGCAFRSSSDASVAIGAVFAIVEGPVVIDKCRMSGSIALDDMHATNVRIFRISAGPVSMTGAKIASQVVLRRIRLRGALVMVKCSIGSVASIDQLFTRPGTRSEGGLFMAAAEVGMSLIIRRSRIAGGISLGGARVTMQIHIGAARIIAGANAALEFASTDCGALELFGLMVEGSVDLSNCQIRRDLTLYETRVDGSRLRLGKSGATVVATEGQGEAASEGRLFNPAIDLTNARIAGDLVIFLCAIAGTLHGRGVRIGRNLDIGLSWLNAGLDWSIDLTNVRCELFIRLKSNLIGSGAALPVSSCSELQIEGTTISCSKNPDHYDLALWASDLSVQRRVEFSGVADEAKSGLALNHVVGRIDLRNSVIGEDFRFASTNVALPHKGESGQVSVAVNLSGCKVTGKCVLADRAFDQTQRAKESGRPARVDGCIQLDDAAVTGDVVLHRTIVRAAGKVARPNSAFASEERVTKRKRGVAVSLKDARIGGELEIGKPDIRGLVDLRGAEMGLLADGGGARWQGAGLQPGHLLLDGLRYARLDEIDDDQNGARRNIGNISVAAERRLRWLLLQFPQMKPCPDTFVPQPYERLARIFAEEGNERARRRVLVEKRDLQRRHGRVGRFERSIGWLLKATSAYGYSPLRATISLALFIALGAILAAVLDSYGALVLANTDSSPANPLNPVAYAIDSALPILDLRQDSVFTIDVSKLPPPYDNRAFVTLVRAAYELIGLVLVSITVLTMTGTLREKD